MKTFVIDYETTGLSPYIGDKIFCAVIFDVDTGESNILWRENNIHFVDQLKQIWQNENIVKVCHNLKFELAFTIKDLGIDNIKGDLHDTMIMHQLLENNAIAHDLSYVANSICGYNPQWDKADKAINEARKIYGTYDKIPKNLMSEYVTYDGLRTAIIYKTYKPYFDKDQTLFTNYQVELNTVYLTQRFEQRGVKIAVKEVNNLINDLKSKLEIVEQEKINTLGLINLNSPKQLNKLLFEDKKFTVIAKTKTGQNDTSKDTIEALHDLYNDPCLDIILKNRSYIKGIAMVESYKKLMDKEGILHPNINTNSATTGRETSSNPNLQNVSKEFALKNRFPIPARKCFRARSGFILLLCDYAGIEMRLGVQGTKSKRLFDLARKDFDFHAATAQSFYKDKFTNGTDLQKKIFRSAAKNARFAMFYGAGLNKVAKTLNLSIEETREGYERDKIEYPEFYDFMENCSTFARKNGYIETFFGRKLKVERHKPYIATDYCIQGSAAGLFKRAQIAVDNLISKQFKNDIYMLLPVHDELIFEVNRKSLKYLDEIKKEITARMTFFVEIDVPLSIEWKQSNYTWDKAK